MALIGFYRKMFFYNRCERQPGLNLFNFHIQPGLPKKIVDKKDKIRPLMNL